jgi:hypothetical protein
MELTDTTLLNLTTRFATKQNNLSLTTTGTSGAATLVGSTLNIPQYSSGGGSGTVTSVGTGYGLLGGPITTTGTLTVDTSTVYDFVRDSIVSVEIGGDTIKILKQEYTPATSDTLTWTVTSKFPIQLRQFILLFRNGQLLLNDQFSIIDTNKVKVAASSFKLGENYTLVTVSGIGSVSSGQGNPVYPEAGIALSTGTTWTTSITNNSSNWNTAFTDRLKWDGGSTGLVAATGRTSLGGTTIGQNMFTLTNPSAITFPRFNADNTVTALSAASFRSAIGAGTVTSVNVVAGTPMSITNNTTTPEINMVAATGSVNGYLTFSDWNIFNNKQNQLNGTGFVKASGTSITYDNSTYLTTATASSTYLPLTGGTISGTSNANNYTDTLLNVNYQHTGFPTNQNVSGIITNVNTNGENAFGITSEASTIYKTAIGIKGKANLLATGGNGIAYGVLGEITATAGGGSASNSYAGYFNNTSTISDGNHYGLYVNTASGGDYGIYQIGSGTNYFGSNTSIGGTLGVTGNITEAGNNVLTNLDTVSLSNRIDAKGNGTVTNVSGSGAISVATGTTTPVISVADAAFGTAGIVTASGTQQFSGDKVFEGITQFNARAVFKDYTYVATRLAGLSSTDRFATVTIGSGLSLSSGTLSATGGTGTVTNVTGTLPISVANGTTTPSITIANASTTASGVVTTGTQSFAGTKTFTNIVGFQRAIQRPVETITVSSASITTSNTWVIVNNAGTVTLTLPSASTSTGTEFFIKTITNNAVVSASSNIVPLTGGSASTPILSASAGKWATLVSDGTNWIIMQAN